MSQSPTDIATPAPADQSPGGAPPPQPKPWLSPRGILVLFIVAVAIRWFYSAIRELVPDEAYYWVWSRHLALSYFDHPPMIAYIIRLGTNILGQSELGVRWIGALLAMGAVLIVTALTRKMLDDARPAAFVAVMLFVSPMVNVLGSVMTPDTPCCFFEAAALACAALIFLPRPGEDSSPRRGPLWLAFGALLGLALLSKYTAVMLGGCVFLAMISTTQGRAHLKTIWPWLGAILSLLFFSPVVYWNAHHGWASFSFQVHHGMGHDDKPPLDNLLNYIGGQAAVCTPILFILVLTAAVVYCRRWKSLPTHHRIILLATALPLAFFACSSLRHHVEANWPVFSYFPGTILVSMYLLEQWNGRRVAWARAAVIVALFATIVMHVPEVVWAAYPKIGVQQWDEMFGWREMAEKVHDLAGYRPIFGLDYRYASELSFYLPGQPPVYLVSDYPAERATQFDYFPHRPKLTDYNSVVLVRRAPKGPLKPLPGFKFAQFPCNINMHGRTIRQSLILINHK